MTTQTSELVPASELPARFRIPSGYHKPVYMHAELRARGRVALHHGDGDVVIVLSANQRVAILR